MQRLHVPRREGLSLYVPSAHLTHRDSSLGEQTVKDPAGHFLQDGLDNLGELPLSDCENTGGVQQQRNQFCRIKLCFPEKKTKQNKKKALNGGGEGRGCGRGGKGEREGREGGEGGEGRGRGRGGLLCVPLFSTLQCLHLLSWLLRSRKKILVLNSVGSLDCVINSYSLKK